MRHTFNIHVGASLLLLICVFIVTGCGSSPASSSTTTASSGTVVTMPEISKGCGIASTVHPGNSDLQVIVSSGMTRSYLLHIPRNYIDTVQTPLVLNFHGHGSNPVQQAYYTDFSTLADQQHFIVAYPQGVVGPDKHTGWATGPKFNPQVNDVLFVSNLLNYLQSTLCINPTRIYATGFSNGGGMTNLLACKMADRIAAFAPVSGAYPAVPGGCHPARPVPIIEFHGTADRIVPYNGRPSKGYPPVTQWLQSWVKLDSCSATPMITQPVPNVTEEQWRDCKGNVTLIHYRIEGWPHAWPRTVPLKHFLPDPHNPHHKHLVVISTSIDATPMIWSFFEAHPLPSTISSSS